MPCLARTVQSHGPRTPTDQLPRPRGQTKHYGIATRGPRPTRRWPRRVRALAEPGVPGFTIAHDAQSAGLGARLLVGERERDPRAASTPRRCDDPRRADALHRRGHELRLGARGDRLRAPRLARGRPDRRRRRRLPRARARAGGRLMGAHDFDFLPGRWDIHNRRLVDMLDPACDEWEEFAATSAAFAMLGGYGNHDHFVTDGYEGFSLRLYSPEEDLWRIWWSSTAPPGPAGPAGRGPLLRRRHDGPLRDRRRARRRAAADALRLVGDHRRRRPAGTSRSPSTRARRGCPTGRCCSRARSSRGDGTRMAGSDPAARRVTLRRVDSGGAATRGAVPEPAMRPSPRPGEVPGGSARG